MAFPLLIISCFIFKNTSLRPKLQLADSNNCRSHPDNKISNHIECQVYTYKYVNIFCICMYVLNIVILRIWFLKHNYKQNHISTFIYWEVVPFGVHSKGKFSLVRNHYFLKCQPSAVRQNVVYPRCSIDVDSVWHKKEMCLSKCF